MPLQCSAVTSVCRVTPDRGSSCTRTGGRRVGFARGLYVFVLQGNMMSYCRNNDWSFFRIVYESAADVHPVGPPHPSARR